MLPSAFYEPDGDGFASTLYTRGPWDPGQQHAGPPAALLARAAVRASGIPDGQTVRLSFDILRPIPIERLTVESRVLRPGRAVEQVESTLFDAGGTPVTRLTCWRMRVEPVELPDGILPSEPPPPPPETGVELGFDWWKDEVTYFRALDWRFIEGEFRVPGPSTCWTRLRVPLVAGEPTTPLERLLVMADAASGVSSTLPWDTWLFVNVDLGIHLERPPEGEWMAMAARTRLSRMGAGQCVAELHDARGRVGVSTQSLLVRSR